MDEKQPLAEPVMEEERTVRVRRRRRTDTPAGAPRERAEAPRRERPSAGGAGLPPRPPAGPGGPGGPTGPAGPVGPGGYGGPSMPSLPIGGLGCLRSPMALLLILLIVAAFFIIPMFLDNGEETGPQGQDNVAVVEPAATEPAQPTPQPILPRATPRPAATRAPDEGVTPGQTWLVMLYQNADDKVLEKDIFVDLNEAERVGSSDRVQIVSQMDRYRAGYQGDGDWDSTRRFYVTQDNDLERVGSPEIADVGEANMADGGTLVDFVTWAIETYPADRHVLILSDHGLGWPGGWSDPTARGQAAGDLPIADVLGDQLYLAELDQALETIRRQTGLEQFELVGLDACLMGHLEVFSALAPHARYAVASQETEPALGWAYAAFLAALQQNPDISGAELGRLIVDSYIVADQRVTDDEARADLVGRGNPLEGIFGIFTTPTAEQISRQLSQNMTLTAADLTRLPALMESVNALAYSLQNADPRGVAQARSYSQSFTNVFGEGVSPSYIDLGHFAQLLAESTRGQGAQQVVVAAGAVLGALNQVVVAEKHGPQRPGATGVSIYFPPSQLYRSPLTGPQSYLLVANRFAQESLWDDYLTFHYTGQGFEQAPAPPTAPDRIETVQAPGRGEITLGPVEASAQSVAPGETVLLRAHVAGQNIGYIKLFVGYFDPQANSIYVADMDYLESPRTRELNGVYYPDWGEGEFTLEFEWEPVVFAISNGVENAVALFTPESYGATYRQATYTVDGIYTFADGETRFARLYFQDQALRQVFAYTGEAGVGAPWEVAPAPGDRFTVLDQWMDLDDNGRVIEMARQDGQTLAFEDQVFTWETLDAAAGEYLVGFIVEDLDGNEQASYTTIQVE
ncbi:MAG TPA: clostripain-related cysteine peptidase [Caldilineaceae bacterium]|nr:clostripain-related cysteine peptidase [Caldilineaceae bacterium]